MPWDIKRDRRCTASKPFGVVKRADNELEGCHASRTAAVRQLAALNAAEAGKETKQAFRRYTYNGVTVQATGRRSSDRSDKKYMRTVRQGDRERVVYYGDPNLPMRRNNPAARRNFLRRHNCDEKRDPFAPGFWACYDWANVEEKGMSEETTTDGIAETEDKEYVTAIGGEPVTTMDVGPISFSEMQAEQQAMEAAFEVNEMARQFPIMVRRIFNRPDIEDKDSALETLAGEFVEMSQQKLSETESKELGGCPDCMSADEFILPDEGDVLTEALAEELKELGIDDLHYKFTGSPRNKFGTHSSYGFKGNYASAWRTHFSKVGGGALTGTASGPLRGTVRRTEMIAAGMKPPCKLPSTESISARGGAKSPLPGSFPEKPSDYGLSSWVKPEDEKDREGMKLSCDDLATIKRAALGEIKWRQKQRESKEHSLLGRAIDALKSVFGEPEPEESPKGNFFLWKEGDRYRWFAIFSNNYRDNDNPPEILAAEAHEDFVKAVDSHEWPYPELRHWHIPGSRWGVADWLAFDGNFAMASGLIDKGHEAEAEAVAAMDGVLVSHGMPRKEVVRSDEDPTVITRYRSIELSDLPCEAAANLLTGFSILDKEASMPLPKDKKRYLQGVGLSDEQIEQIEADLEGKKETADTAGLEAKDQTEEATPTTEPAGDDTPVSRSEVEELARIVGEGLQALAGQVSELAGEVKQLKERGEEDEALSLSDIFTSAIGHNQARQDKRQTLAKSRPKETPVPEEATGPVLASNNALLNDILNGIVTGEAWQGFPGAEQQGEEVQ